MLPAVRTLALLLGLLAVAGGAWRGLGAASVMPGVDFYVPWTLVQLRQDGVDPLLPYDAEQRVRLHAIGQLGAASDGGSVYRQAASMHRAYLDATASPFLYAVMGGTWTGDYDADLQRYRWLQLAAFFLALVLAARLAKVPAWWAAPYAAACAWLHASLPGELAAGNVNALHVLLVTGALVLGRRGGQGAVMGAAAVATMAVLFKPTVAIGVAAWGVALAWREGVRTVAMGAALGAAAAWLAGAAFLGPGAWPAWMAQLGYLASLQRDAASGNFSLTAWGAARGLPVPGAVVVGALLLAMAASWWRRPPRNGAEDLALVAAGTAAMFAGANLVWSHYLLALAPLGLALLAQRPDNPNASAAWGATWVGLACTMQYPPLMLAPAGVTVTDVLPWLVGLGSAVVAISVGFARPTAEVPSQSGAA